MSTTRRTSARSVAVASVLAAAALGTAAGPALANESHGHGHSPGSGSGSGPGAGSSSSGRGTTVNTRTATATIGPSDGFVTVDAKCEANEVPVNGYWLVDGEEPDGNSKVIYSSSSTGERPDGYRVVAANGAGFLGNAVNAAPITVTVFARCLVVDNSNS